MGIRAAVTMTLLYYGVLLSIMAGAAFIDIKHFIIPNNLIIFGMLFSFIFAVFAALSASEAAPLIQWLTGLLLGGAPAFFIILITRGKMGAGDIKLLAVTGAFLGWQQAFIVLFFAIVTGGAYSVAQLLMGRKTLKDIIPFGPFIAIASVIVIVFYPQIESILASYYGIQIISR